MRPPDCYVCHRTLDDFPDDGRDNFTLIYFGETRQEKLGPTRPDGWAGHRYNAVWFCSGHVAVARQHENRHRDEALAAIKAQFEAGEGS